MRQLRKYETNLNCINILKNLVARPSETKTSAEFFSCHSEMFPNFTKDHLISRFNHRSTQSTVESQREKENPQNSVLGGWNAARLQFCAARAAVSKIVRPTVRRWRPMVGIQKLQPRPSNLNKHLFAGFVGLERSKFSKINHRTEYVNSRVVVGISIKIFCLNTKGNSTHGADT